MEPFKDFIKEHYMIARVNMPQIEDIEAFADWVVSKGVTVESNFGKVNHLKPTQAEGFNYQKVESIAAKLIEDPDSAQRMNPIIVSEDDFVIDGHHRYLAAKQHNLNVPYIVIGATSNQVLKLAKDYEATD